MDYREFVVRLIDEKREIEAEIQALTDILNQNGVGMKDSLIDEEGFPMSNVDIHQVRNARHRIICLQNDHKAIMEQIERGLEGYYAKTSCETSTPQSSSVPHQSNIQNRSEFKNKTPFARVANVIHSSPAYYAGLQDNDLILQFGSVNASNFKNITDIATVVQHSEGCTISVLLRRDDTITNLEMTPKRWPGKGLLGCNIVPIPVMLQ